MFGNWITRNSPCFLAAAVLVTLSTLAQSFEVFEPIGISPGGADSTMVTRVSPDGTSILGQTSASGAGVASAAPFIWRVDTGLFALTNGAGMPARNGVDVANGGNRAVFQDAGDAADKGARGLFWTRTNGFQTLGRLTDGTYREVVPAAISSDGRVIVGKAKSANAPSFDRWEAFRWTVETGLVGIGDVTGTPENDRFDSSAIGVSSDGRIIVGQVRYGGGVSFNGGLAGDFPPFFAAARWIDGGPPQMLPKPSQAEDAQGFFASGVSPNGTFILGHYRFGRVTHPDGSHAEEYFRTFRWSEQEGYLMLHEFRYPGDQRGVDSFVARDVSNDGQTVVGEFLPRVGQGGAAIWMPQGGVRFLKDLLSERGINLEGYTLTSASSVSADGRVIVGSAVNIGGKARGYRVALWDLPPRKIIVNSVADRPALSGANCCDTGEKLANGDVECTFRAALEAVNAGCGDRIEFAIAEAAIPKITPQTPLPAIRARVDIDGTTQSGGRVEISGTDSTGICLDLQGGSSIVRGLVINHFKGGNGAAIRILGGGNNRIVGNYLGTEVSGNEKAFNVLNVVVTNSSNNEIGSTLPGDGNVISDALWIAGGASTGNRIVANRIGLGADGESRIGRTLGILVSGGSGTTIGGPAGSGNYLGGFEEAAIAISEGRNVTVEGNYVGLAVGGSHGSGGAIGILGAATRDPGIANLIIRSNRIAGVRAGIMVLGSKTTGAQITDNLIGTRFDGSGLLPAGIDPDYLRYGIRVDGAPNAQVFRNLVAGADFNLLLAGKPQAVYLPCDDVDGDGVCDTGSEVQFYSPEDPFEEDDAFPFVGGAIVGGNTFGLNEKFLVPAGAKQRFGVAVYRGARDLQLRNNIVAGHSESDVWLRDGVQLQLMQNRIGAVDGVTRNSQTGVTIDQTSDVTIAASGSFIANTISHQKKAAILVRGGATNLLIRGNNLGTGPGGAAAWPNGSGVIAAGPNITGLRLENNLISGSVTQAVLLEQTDKVVLQGNRIGISSAGLGLSNRLGVVIRNTPTELRDNIIAYNGTGIIVTGEQPVLFQGGPLYLNGDGTPAAAVAYADQSIPTPSVFVLQKLTTPGGKVALAFKGIAPSASAGQVEIEIYGNRAGEKQGRTPLGRKTVQPNVEFSFVLEGEPGSAFDTLPEFSATATQNSRTSMLVPVRPVTLEAKPIVTATSATDISLQWPAGLDFSLESGESPTGPWRPVLIVPMVVDEVATVTLPLDGHSQFFRLVLNN